MGCGPSSSKQKNQNNQKDDSEHQSKKQKMYLQTNNLNNQNTTQNDQEVFVSTPARKNKEQKETASSDNIKQFYELGQVQGSGQFGTVRISHSIQEKSRLFAIKTIEKERMGEKAYMLRRELEILKTLDHPNVIKFYEIFQDEKSIHFVMEHCSGGDVYNSIIKNGYFKEQEAAFFMQKIFSALAHMHSKNVIHRDLKPENLLFANTQDDSEIKIIDFGLSRIFIPDYLKQLPSVVGTPLYVAPEVIEQTFYGKECDNWSLGVVTFFILCGKEPFYAGTIGEVYNKIKNADFQFKGEPWDRISDEAKDMISKLLVVDPKKRMTAEQALQHPWFQRFTSSQQPKQEKIQKYSKYIQNMLDNKCYLPQNQLRKEAVKIIINHYITQQEIEQMLYTFRILDFNKNGELQYSEISQAMDLLNKTQKEKEQMKQVFQNMHCNENLLEIQQQQSQKQELVLYQGEFLRSALDLKQYLSDKILNSLFQFFDRSGNMQITKCDIKEIIAREGRKVSDEELDKIMLQSTNSKSGSINFDQFKNIMVKDIL